MNLRERLRLGQWAVGCWINTGSTIVAELLASLKYDFLVVDVEHSAVDLPQAQLLFQAISSAGTQCLPWVRVPGLEYATTKRFLDAGAYGVIAPLVNTADDAARVVRAARYPPDGERGVGFARSNSYGLEIEKSVSTSNEEIAICVQIEHYRAIENLEEILRVPGIDAAFAGPYDLSASMGITGEFDHPDMIAATERILEVCKRNRIAPGIHVVQPNPEEVRRRFDEGFRLIGYSLDITMLANIAKDGLVAIIDQLPSRET